MGTYIVSALLGIFAYALGYLNGVNRGYKLGKEAGYLQGKYPWLKEDSTHV